LSSECVIFVYLGVDLVAQSSFFVVFGVVIGWVEDGFVAFW